MKIAWKYKRFFAASLILIALWAIYFICGFIYFPSKITNLRHIPKDASYTAIIQLDKLVKQGIYDGIITNEDEAFFNLLQQKRQQQRNSSKNLGVNFLSPVAIVGINFKQDVYKSFFINLSNYNDFKYNLIPQLPANYVVVYDQDKAILLDGKHQFSSKDRVHIKKQLKSYLSTKSEGFNLQQDVTFSFFKRANAPRKNIQFEGNLIGNQLEIHGIFPHESNEMANYSLKKDGFHLSSQLIPAIEILKIQQQLAKKDIFIPNFNAISLNYRGLEMNNGQFFPQFDLLLKVDSTFQIETLIHQEKIIKLNSKLHKINNDHYILQLDKKEVILKKIHPTHLFIGEKESNILFRKPQNSVEVSGDLKLITTIKNGGFLGIGIQMYPPIRLFNESIQKVEKLEIQLSKNGKFKAELLYKDNAVAISELTKLIVNLQSEFGQ